MTARRATAALPIHFGTLADAGRGCAQVLHCLRTGADLQVPGGRTVRGYRALALLLRDRGLVERDPAAQRWRIHLPGLQQLARSVP